MARRKLIDDTTTTTTNIAALTARKRLHGVCLVLASEHTNPRVVQHYRESGAHYKAIRESLNPTQLQLHDAEWAQHKCSGSIACPHAKAVLRELQSK